jgi:hypothetical protein
MGIDRLDRATCASPRRSGYRIKLLAVAELGRRRAGAARLADAGEARPAAVRRERAVQRHPRGGRRGGPADVLRPGRRPDADRVGRGGRHDRHRGRPHGDHLPHAGAVVQTEGPRHASRTRQGGPGGSTCASMPRIIRACWRKWPTCWDSTRFRSPACCSRKWPRKTTSCRW